MNHKDFANNVFSVVIITALMAKRKNLTIPNKILPEIPNNATLQEIADGIVKALVAKLDQDAAKYYLSSVESIRRALEIEGISADLPDQMVILALISKHFKS